MNAPQNDEEKDPKSQPVNPEWVCDHQGCNKYYDSSRDLVCGGCGSVVRYHDDF